MSEITPNWVVFKLKGIYKRSLENARDIERVKSYYKECFGINISSLFIEEMLTEFRHGNFCLDTFKEIVKNTIKDRENDE